MEEEELVVSDLLQEDLDQGGVPIMDHPLPQMGSAGGLTMTLEIEDQIEIEIVGIEEIIEIDPIDDVHVHQLLELQLDDLKREERK